MFQRGNSSNGMLPGYQAYSPKVRKGSSKGGVGLSSIALVLLSIFLAGYAYTLNSRLTKAYLEMDDLALIQKQRSTDLQRTRDHLTKTVRDKAAADKLAKSFKAEAVDLKADLKVKTFELESLQAQYDELHDGTEEAKRIIENELHGEYATKVGKLLAEVDKHRYQASDLTSKLKAIERKAAQAELDATASAERASFLQEVHDHNSKESKTLRHEIAELQRRLQHVYAKDAKAKGVKAPPPVKGQQENVEEEAAPPPPPKLLHASVSRGGRHNPVPKMHFPHPDGLPHKPSMMETHMGVDHKAKKEAEEAAARAAEEEEASDDEDDDDDDGYDDSFDERDWHHYYDYH